MRPEVLQWGHESKVACHPGVRRSLAAIRQQFLACSVCAQNKVSNRPSVGLFQPLPIPSCPWSHIALDFVSGLPPSRGYTVILKVVDCFSKAVHFMPLPKLPSAKETAQLVIDHVFWIHGVPVDVVSDKGPQFVSRFWQEFCRQIGASLGEGVLSRSRWGLPCFCCPGAHGLLFWQLTMCSAVIVVYTPPILLSCVLTLPPHLHSILSSLSPLYHALVFAVLCQSVMRCSEVQIISLLLCYLTLSRFVYFF